MDVGTFDRPGSWELRPKISYLRDADSFPEFAERLQEAKDLPDKLDALDRKLTDAWEQERRLRVKIRNAESSLSRIENSMSYEYGEAEAHDEVEELEDGLADLRADLGDVLEEIETLRDRREELARTIEKRFHAVQVAKGVPDLSAPDESAVKDRIVVY